MRAAIRWRAENVPGADEADRANDWDRCNNRGTVRKSQVYNEDGSHKDGWGYDYFGDRWGPQE